MRFNLLLVSALLLTVSIRLGFGQLGPGWLSSPAPSGPVVAPITAADAGLSFSSGPQTVPKYLAPPVGSAASLARALLPVAAVAPVVLGNEADEITPAIASLARGLFFDPVKIFEFVHNFIDYEPYYGCSKGAHLTLMEKSGNDFDQAALLVALLRASECSAVYRFGVCGFTWPQLTKWVGLSDTPFAQLNDAAFTARFSLSASTPNRRNQAVNDFFWNGGTPYFGMSTSGADVVYRLPHVWVEYSKGGSKYQMFPAYKEYREVAGIDFGSLTQYSRADFLNTIGGVETDSSAFPDSVTAIKYDLLSNKLRDYTTNLNAQLKDSLHRKSFEEIAGGRQIAGKSYNTLLDLDTPSYGINYSWFPLVSWSAIPDSEMAKLEIACGDYNSASQQFSSTLYSQTVSFPSLQGKRLSMHFLGNTTTIAKDDNALGISFAVITPTVSVRLRVIHNYFTLIKQPGTTETYVVQPRSIAVQEEVKSYLKADSNVYAFPYCFGNPDKLAAEREEVLLRLRRDAIPDTDWRVKAESLNVMGLEWFCQTDRVFRLTARAFNCQPIWLHRLGRVAQEAGFYIDVGMQLSARPNAVQDAQQIDAAAQVAGLFASAMEHGVIEQMQGDATQAVSTVKALFLANQNQQPIYRATPANWTAVQSQLVNYPAGALATISGAATDTSGKVLLPKSGSLTLNSWTGYGFAVQSAGRILMAIQGGVGQINGGYNSTASAQDISAIWNWIRSSTVEENGISTLLQTTPQTHSRTPMLRSTDPVDMQTGAFLVDSTDLVAGQPDRISHGFAFTKHYNSNSRYVYSADLGYGWTHDYDGSCTKRSSYKPILGGTISYHAAPFLAALAVVKDLQLSGTKAKHWVGAALVAHWLVDQLKQNAINVILGTKSIEFIKMPDGSYLPPAGMNVELIRNGDHWEVKVRNGPTYVFFSETNATVGIRGKLVYIKDVWGKFITLTYTNGLLSNAWDTRGRRLMFARETIYAGAGPITRVILSLGGTNTANDGQIVFSYNGFDLASATDVAGKKSQFGYDADHRMTITKDTTGDVVVKNFYDDEGRVIEQYGFGLVDRKYTLHYAGVCNTEVDPLGGRKRFLYDLQGRAVATIDALGNCAETAYDGQDRMVSTTTPTGQTTRQEYDSNNNLTKITDPAGNVTVMTYDSLNRLKTTTDPMGNVTTVDSYNDKHQPTKITAPLGRVSQMDYGPTYGDLTKVTDPLGNVTLYAYPGTGLGRDVTITYPDASKVSMNYSTFGALAKTTDGNGGITSFAANKRLQPLKTTLPSVLSTSKPTTASAVIETQYDEEGRVKNSIDALGNSTVATYTISGQVKTSTPPAFSNPGTTALLTNTITNSYDFRDWLVSSTDSLLRIVQPVYDAAHRQTGSIDALNRTTTSLLDADGRVKQVSIPTDGPARISATKYNVRGEVETTTDPLGKETGFTYDANGNLKTRKDRLGRIHTYDYDEANRLIHTTTPGARTTVTAYNLADLPTTVTEPSSQLTSMTYDKRLRPATKTDGVGAVTFGYDDNSNLETVTETATGQTSVVSRTFDARNQLKTFTTADGDYITYDYDLNGAMTRMTYPPELPVSAGTFVVGSQYKITTLGTTAFKSIGAAANTVGTIFKATGVGTGTGTAQLIRMVEYTYNARNSLSTVTDWAGRKTNYHYDRVGRLVRVDRPNGTASVLQQDDAGQLISLRETRMEANGSGATPGTRLFYYQKFGYNLSGEVVKKFTAPDPGNHTQPTFAATYDSDNRLSTVNGSQVSHDLDGNMTSGPITAASGFKTLVYNARNQLTQADGTTYTYDAEGRRRNSTTSAGTTRYVTDAAGNLIIKIAPGGGRTYYVYGVGLLYEAAKVGTAPEKTITYHYDQVGSTVARTDDTGKDVGRAAYSPYGQLTWQTGNMATPFLYNGRLGVMTEANGLLNMRARYYSPYLMRFLNADPSGFGGGSNWFAYADGNPISLADPFGLDATNAGDILRNTPRPPWDPIFGPPTMDFGVYAGYNCVYDQFGGRHESFCAVCHDGSVNAQVLQRMTMEGPNGMWIQVGLAFGNAAFGELLSIGAAGLAVEEAVNLGSGQAGWINSGSVIDAEIIIDENLSPVLESYLQNRGYYAYALPKGLSDAEIIAYAQTRNAVVLTNNTADFVGKGVGVLDVPSRLQTRESLGSLINSLDAVKTTPLGPNTVIKLR